MTGFLVVGGLGLGLVVVALVLGDFFDGLLPDVSLDGGSLLSTEVVGSFLAAFGFTAALLAGPGGFVAWAAALGGLGAGLGVGFAAFSFSRSLLNMPTDPTPRTRDLVGRIGTVVTRIPDAGLGEVVVAAGGQRHKLNARAQGPIAAGTTVVVVDVASPTSVVVTESGF